MKKILSFILGILFVANIAYAAQTTVNTSSDTFQTAWDRQQAMNTEVYPAIFGDIIHLDASGGSASITNLNLVYYIQAAATATTITIPDAAAGNEGGFLRLYKESGAGDVTIQTVSSQDIGGSSTAFINHLGEGLTIKSDDSTEWLKLQDSRIRGINFNGKSVATDYTLTTEDYIIGVDTSGGDITITVPDAATLNPGNWHWEIWNITDDENKVIVTLADSGQSFAEYATYNLKHKGAAVGINLYDAANVYWFTALGAVSSFESPTVGTYNPSLASITLTMNGELLSLGNSAVTDCYFEYREEGTLPWTATSDQQKTSIGTYNDTATVTAALVYEVRAVAELATGAKAYGAILNTGNDYYATIEDAKIDGLVRYWALQETTGVDIACEENLENDTATAYNGVTIGSDSINSNTIYKRVFGASDYTEASFKMSIAGTYTFLVQVDMNSISGDHTIFSNGANVLSLASDGTRIELKSGRTTNNWDSATPFAAIKNLFVTYDPNNGAVKCYEVTSSSATLRASKTTIPTAGAQFFRVGRGAAGDNLHQDYEYMDDGIVRSVAIWDRVMTTPEMEEIADTLDNDGGLIVTDSSYVPIPAEHGVNASIANHRDVNDDIISNVSDKGMLMWDAATQKFIAQTTAERGAVLEADMLLQNMQGAVTDGQVPNDITITNLSGTNTGDNSANTTYTIGSATQAFDAFLDDISDLTDPGGDRLLFFDDSAGFLDWLIIGSGLTLTDKTLTAAGGATAWDDLGDPDAASSNNFGVHVIKLYVDDFWIGKDDTDYIRFTDTGITLHGAYTFTGTWTFTDGDVTPTAGQLVYDNNVIGITDGLLSYHNFTGVRFIVDLDTLPINDDYVIAYDAGADKFYMKADAGGAETNSLETVTTGILENEIPIGKAGGDAVTYGTDLPTATTIGTAYVYRAGGTDVPDGDVANDITAGTVILDDDTSVEIMADHDGMDDDEHNGITVTGLNAGEGLTQWDLVRLADDTDPWHQADANAAGEFPAQGIVVATTSDTNEAKVLMQGVVRNEGWTGLTIGGAVYLSTTVGGITQTAPSISNDCIQIVGYAISDSEILFDFSKSYSEVE